MNQQQCDSLRERQRDKQLSAAEQAQLEQFLAQHPEEARAWHADAAFDQQFGQALQSSLDSAQLSFAAVARMRARLDRTGPIHRSVGMALLCVTVAALLLVWVLARNLLPLAGTVGESAAPQTAAPVAPAENVPQMISASATADSAANTTVPTITTTPEDAEQTKTARAIAASDATVQVIWSANRTAQAVYDATMQVMIETAQAAPSDTPPPYPVTSPTPSGASPTPSITPSSTLIPADQIATVQVLQATAQIMELTITPTPPDYPAAATATSEMLNAQQTATAILVRNDFDPRTPTATMSAADQTATIQAEYLTATPELFPPTATASNAEATSTAQAEQTSIARGR